MTAQDRQLWKSIRDSMAEAELEWGTRATIYLNREEFNLLYGEVNAKCSEEISCSCCGCAGACIHDDCSGCGGKRGFIGQDAQVLRHADTVEGWQHSHNEFSCLSCGEVMDTADEMQAHLATHKRTWTAKEILDREG